MSELGPLPEQPFVDWLIPTDDLRDAIRVEHGLDPLYEEDVYVGERFPNKDIWLTAAGILAVIIAWQFNEALVIAVTGLVFLLGWISKQLFLR